MKERLKKESEEYAEGMAKYYASTHEDCIPSQFEKYLRNAYISSAEPREKRIAELEEENAELRYQLNKNPCVKTPEWHCSDCLKENAELQEQNRKLLESCEGATMMYEDLCKAKDILQDFANLDGAIHIPMDKVKSLMVKAEKFLKN